MTTERPLQYLPRFEDGRPDLYHELAHEVCRPYLTAGRLLDVGCWTGAFASLLDGRTRAIGVDREWQATRIAARGAASTGGGRHRFTVGNIQALPFRDGQFQTALMNYVLEHLERGSDRRTLAEVRRVLQPGGRLIILVPRRHWFHAICDIAYWTVGHRHFREDEVRGLLRDAGFDVESAETRGGVGAAISIPVFYAAKYLLRINLYKIGWAKRWLHWDYATRGFRDLFVVARRAA